MKEIFENCKSDDKNKNTRLRREPWKIIKICRR